MRYIASFLLSLFLLSACSENGEESSIPGSGSQPRPLAEDPPIGAADIDALVAEEQGRMTKDAGNGN